MFGLIVTLSLTGLFFFYAFAWVLARVIAHAVFCAKLNYQLTLVAELEAQHNRGVPRNG